MSLVTRVAAGGRGARWVALIVREGQSGAYPLVGWEVTPERGVEPTVLIGKCPYPEHRLPADYRIHGLYDLAADGEQARLNDDRRNLSTKEI